MVFGFLHKALSQKAKVLLKKLQKHLTSDTGKPKPLGYCYKGLFSRRITKKHRLVYSINDEKNTVLVIAVAGHYDDK
jgi:toxin YoeB